MGYQCNLKCWSCGKTQPIEVDVPPRFAFEVVGMANDIGWHGVIDMEHHRSLVFCSEVCVEMAKKKDGGFRVRPSKVVSS